MKSTVSRAPSSAVHLYQCILDGEEHVKDITYLTTLAGYIHWRLTGQKVLGVGDASGMLPVDSNTKSYDKEIGATKEQIKGYKEEIQRNKEEMKAAKLQLKAAKDDLKQSKKVMKELSK